FRVQRPVRSISKERSRYGAAGQPITHGATHVKAIAQEVPYANRGGNPLCGLGPRRNRNRRVELDDRVALYVGADSQGRAGADNLSERSEVEGQQIALSLRRKARRRRVG